MNRSYKPDHFNMPDNHCYHIYPPCFCSASAIYLILNVLKFCFGSAKFDIEVSIGRGLLKNSIKTFHVLRYGAQHLSA